MSLCPTGIVLRAAANRKALLVQIGARNHLQANRSVAFRFEIPI